TSGERLPASARCVADPSNAVALDAAVPSRRGDVPRSRANKGDVASRQPMTYPAKPAMTTATTATGDSRDTSTAHADQTAKYNPSTMWLAFTSTHPPSDPSPPAAIH